MIVNIYHCLYSSTAYYQHETEPLMSYQFMGSLYHAERGARVKATQKLCLKGKRLWVDIVDDDGSTSHIRIEP